MGSNLFGKGAYAYRGPMRTQDHSMYGVESSFVGASNTKLERDDTHINPVAHSCWPITSPRSYVRRNTFRIDLPEKDCRLEWRDSRY